MQRNRYDDNGFDYGQENDAITDRMKANISRLDEALSANALSNNGMSSVDILNQFSAENDYNSEYRRLEQRARDYRYHYEDRETFDAALELYNRKRCVPSVNPRMGHVANEFWVRKEVRGRHRKPRGECGIDFSRGMDYVQECGQGPWDAEKLCVGCMGRRLKNEVDIDLGAIQSALVPLQRAQPWGILGAGSSVQTFRLDNYRR